MINKEKKIIIGTRFFEKHPSKLVIIEKFINRAIACVDNVLVAVNTNEDKTGVLNDDKLRLPGVDIFGVTPWGEFIPALNNLISKAKINGADLLLIASAEINFFPKHVLELQKHMQEDTLVAGSVFPGHIFSEGEQEGNGRTVPWNTFSLWNLDYLSRTGFPLIGDALFDRKSAGVEEVITIALLQKIYPFLKAKLIKLTGIERETCLWDDWRQARYGAELASRISCPAAQMKVFNIDSPRILHIRCDNEKNNSYN